MSNLHPDASYIMQDDIGLVIAKGLSVVYKERPDNAIDFLGKWLYQQADIKRAEKHEKALEDKVNELKAKEEYDIAVKAKADAEIEVQKKERNDQITAFEKMVTSSDDLRDQLQDLVDHLHDFTGSTAVYVGELTKPIKGFKDGLQEDDDDTAHIIPNAQTEIQLIHASKDHQFLVDQVLKQDQGITYERLYSQAANPKEKEFVKEDPPMHVIVPEIVREPKMHYYRVPKLGSYLAIKLEYNSCLFEDAYDDAIDNYNAVNERQKQQEVEKTEWEAQQAEIQKEREEAGEEYEKEEKEWQTYEYADFRTDKVQFVVCLNTMGQDRQFTQEEIDFALRTVKNYRDTWEQLEVQNLKHDVEAQLKHQSYDALYREHYAARDEAEAEKFIQEAIAAGENEQTAQGEDPLTEIEKEEITRKSQFKSICRAFHAPEEAAIYLGQLDADQRGASGQDQRVSSAMSSVKSGQDKKSIDADAVDPKDIPPFTPLIPEQWLSRCQEFKTLHIVKYQRIFQSLIYLLKFHPQDVVCERDTNKLSWKKTSKLIDPPGLETVFYKLGSYWPFGAKEDEYKEYQKLLFVRDNLEGMGVNEEQVMEYSVALGKLYQWITKALELRINDVVQRRNQKAKERELRQEAIDREAERQEKRSQLLEEAIAKFEEDNKMDQPEKAEGADPLLDDDGNPIEDDEDDGIKFDEEEFDAKFDDENPPTEIPPEVVDDIDNDFNIEIDDQEQE